MFPPGPPRAAAQRRSEAARQQGSEARSGAHGQHEGPAPEPATGPPSERGDQPRATTPVMGMRPSTA